MSHTFWSVTLKTPIVVPAGILEQTEELLRAIAVGALGISSPRIRRSAKSESAPVAIAPPLIDVLLTITQRR